MFLPYGYGQANSLVSVTVLVKDSILVLVLSALNELPLLKGEVHWCTALQEPILTRLWWSDSVLECSILGFLMSTLPFNHKGLFECTSSQLVTIERVILILCFFF